LQDKTIAIAAATTITIQLKSIRISLKATLTSVLPRALLASLNKVIIEIEKQRCLID